MRFVSFLLAFAFAAMAADVRVAMFGLFRPERVTVKPVGTDALRITAGDRTVILQASRVAGIRAVGSELDLFVHREQSSAREIRVSARDGGPVEFLLAVPSKIERRYRGVLHVTAAAGTLSAVVTMDLETAVAAAVAAEMAPDTHPEALKAMAVLARSYYWATRGRHSGFDFCDTTHCQFHRDPARPGTPAFAAASATADLVLAYDGVSFAPMYSAACGGRTRASGAVAGYPYKAVECAACLRDSPSWERRLPLAIGRELLENPYEEARLRVVRELGWDTIPSNNFEARVDGAEVVLRGRGAGHGMGLCQRGASALATSGIDFRSILSQYLPGAVLIEK